MKQLKLSLTEKCLAFGELSRLLRYNIVIISLMSSIFVCLRIQNYNLHKHYKIEPNTVCTSDKCNPLKRWFCYFQAKYSQDKLYKMFIRSIFKIKPGCSLLFVLSVITIPNRLF